MISSYTAIRSDHVGGHVAMAVGPYFPHWSVPLEARKRFQPWSYTFHADDGGPNQFIAFGMIDAVYALLGPLLLRLHGGLFETLAERVDFDLDNTPLAANAPEAFVASPSFVVECYLVGADPHKARLHLETMHASVKNRRSLVL